MRTWTLASAVAAPVVLAGGSVLAQSDQPPGYSAVHNSISQLAAYGAAQRWFMTATLALVRAFYLVTAIGMTALNLVGRVLLIAGGVATSVVAAPPQPTPGVSRLRSDLLLHVYKISHDWSKQLLGSGEAQVVTVPPDRCESGHLDLQDRTLIDLLADDGRASFRTVANSLGLNESTVRRRFDRLQHNGCLSVVTLVPAAALNMESEAMLTIRLAPDRINAVAGALIQHREVRYTAATLDGNSLLCEVIASSTPDLFDFVTNTLAGQPGVLGWNANLELLTLKRGFVQTPWWRREAGLEG